MSYRKSWRWMAALGAITATNAFGQARTECAAGNTGECTTRESDGQSAPRALASAMPMLKCVVGNQVVQCPIEAQKLAKETGQPAEYYLADVKFTDTATACKAWARELSGHFDRITTARFAVGDDCTDCPLEADEKSKAAGKPIGYRLATYTFPCEESAGQATLAALRAADQVSMKIAVGDEQFNCPLLAARASKLAGQPVQYTVGKMTFECDALARCAFMMARVQAAEKALKQAAGA